MKIREICLVRAITLGGFGSVPVLANDGTVVGIVSEFDLLKAIMEGKQLGHAQVGSERGTVALPTGAVPVE
jgi:CBS domain-containing protein